MTVFEAYNDCKKKLQAAGVEDYGFEARAILRRATGLTNTQILSHYNEPLSPFQQNQLIALLHQRQARYPLQYMFGAWDFYGRSFKVGPGVLIPRADTETLAEAVLKLLEKKTAPDILDLCAGSGCVGLTVGAERPDSTVTLVEKYEPAMKYLSENAAAISPANCTAVQGDIFEGAAADRQYDCIVSNPPYIAAEEMGGLPPELSYEPDEALYGGEDGLLFYRAIIDGYKTALRQDGVMAFEVGDRQAAAVCCLLLEAGFCTVDTVQDAGGFQRVVFGTLNAVESAIAEDSANDKIGGE